MKIGKRLVMGLSALACVAVLPSCSDKLAEKWAYSKDEIATFAELEGDVSATDGRTDSYTIDFSFSEPVFTKALEKDDVLFFDAVAAEKELLSSTKEYLDYSIIKNHLIETTSIRTGENLNELSIDYSDDYAAVAGLVYKDCVVHGNFLMLSEYEAEEANEDTQKTFENRYADSSFVEDKGGDLVKGIVSSIGTALIGAAADNPVQVVFGLVGVLANVASIFLPSEPTIADVMKKLETMDMKLNEILNKLDKNFNQLKDEELRTQTKVDKVMLEAQTAAITAFQTDYIKPVDDFKRTLSVGMQNGLKNFVKQSETLNLKLYKNEKGEWCYRSLAVKQDATDADYSFTVATFDKAVADLEAHDNVVTKTFMDALRADLEVGVKGSTLPAGLTADNALGFANAYVNDLMIKNYFLADTGKATDMMNLAINLSKRYSGALGGESIVSTIVKRYQYYYNFGGEMRDPLISTIAKELSYLDAAAALAAIGCKYAGINITELHDTYVAGRNALSSTHKSFKNVKNGYSFILERNLDGGGLYWTHYKNWTTNKGNHPTYHYELEGMHEKGGHRGSSYPANIAEAIKGSISNLDHRRLSFRMNALKSIGAIDSKLNYTDYLAKANVLSADLMETIDSVKKAGFWYDECNKWLTTFNRRSADSRDKGRDVYCNDKGNPGGTWFKTDTYYGYGQSHEWKYWSGEVCEGDLVSGITGELMTDKFLSMYARYDEGHWYWRNDERWSFHDNPVCRFLILKAE